MLQAHFEKDFKNETCFRLLLLAALNADQGNYCPWERLFELLK